MRSIIYKVKDPHGLHARPAGLMAREAMKYSSSVTIEKGGAKADMKKLFSVMGLSVKSGDEIRITIEGKDEEIAERELTRYINENI
jgi:phosphocarrier protein